MLSTLISFNLFPSNYAQRLSPWTRAYEKDIEAMRADPAKKPTFTHLNQVDQLDINAEVIFHKACGRTTAECIIPFLFELIEHYKRNSDNRAYIQWALEHNANPNLERKAMRKYFILNSGCSWTPLVATTHPKVAYLLLRYGACAPDFEYLKANYKHGTDLTTISPHGVPQNILEDHSKNAYIYAQQRIAQEKKTHQDQQAAVGALAHQTTPELIFAATIVEILGK
jgi:hypothetical protein